MPSPAWVFETASHRMGKEEEGVGENAFALLTVAQKAKTISHDDSISKYELLNKKKLYFLDA